VLGLILDFIHPEKATVERLVARGYSEEDIRKISAENHLRVFKEILH